MPSHGSAKPPPLCPRDRLPSQKAKRTSPLFSSSRLQTKGAYKSLLHKTSQCTSSPSLIGNFWNQIAGSKPSFNTGSIQYGGPGIWGRSERGSWAVSGESKYTPGPGQNYFDRLARKREQSLSSIERCTFGVLGHQEDSHLDRLERQHREQPGPADNAPRSRLGNKHFDASSAIAAKLNSLCRHIKKVEDCKAKKNIGTHLSCEERKIFNKDVKRLAYLKKRARELARTGKAQATLVKENAGRLAREKSEKNIKRFVQMELILREKRQEPAPGYTQSLAVPHVGGGRFSNIPRLVPAYNYKNIKSTPDGAAILLQRDNSFVDVGPGQFSPTYAPAVGCSKAAPARIPALNPRSRASDALKPGTTQKLFRNSQLLPTAPTALDSSKMLEEGEYGTDLDEEIHGPEIWWTTKQGLTQRPRPYGAYKGGRQKQHPDIHSAQIQPAFIPNASYVRQPNDATNKDIGVERFLFSVPYAVGKQKAGPKHLPMRTMLQQEHQDRQAKRFQKSVERDRDAVANL